MTKQHSSSMYVGFLLYTSTVSLLPFVRESFFIVFSLRDKVTVQESTISMQLKSVLYKSKHRFRDFTKQTWTLLLFDPDSVTFILCDAIRCFLLLHSAPPKLIPWEEAKL